MTDQTTATLPATDQATFSRTGLLFGALCLVALIAPLVHVKPNRILAGEGLALPLALNAPIGWVISATLLALTAATLSRRRRAMQLVGLALIGLGLTILSLGLAARQLSPEGNAIIRIDQYLIILVQNQINRVKIVNSAFFFKFYSDDVGQHIEILIFIFTCEA